MIRLAHTRLASVIAAAVAAVLFLGGPASAAPMDGAVSEVRVVAGGLDNPRGLAVDRSGAVVLVAEAGRGGQSPCVPDYAGSPHCLSQTGAVTAVVAGRQHRILTGLPSLATADGSDIAGPQDVWLGRRGELLLAVGLGNTADRRSQLGAAASRLGTIQRFVPGKGLTTIVDVAQYELGANPDGSSTPDGRDSNPYSVAADGSGFLVSDAGGNTVYRVGRNGSIRPLVVLPVRSVPAPTFLGLPPGAMTPMQAVPTAALRAPDGSYFVAELTGFPFPVGEARVYRVSAGGSPTIAATGFTNIIDIALDRHGRLYVLELTTEGLLSGATTGQITRVDLRSGTRTVLQTPPLDSPTSLAIASDGHTLYVTNHGRSVGAGEILRMRLTS